MSRWLKACLVAGLLNLILLGLYISILTLSEWRIRRLEYRKEYKIYQELITTEIDNLHTQQQIDKIQLKKKWYQAQYSIWLEPLIDTFPGKDGKRYLRGVQIVTTGEDSVQHSRFYPLKDPVPLSEDTTW